MQVMTMALHGVSCATLIFSSTTVSGQAVVRDSQLTAVVQQLFVAMRASDTAATRSAFVGRNAPGTWIQRVWNLAVRTTSPLDVLWFEYDVFRGPTFDHCGISSVQLQETTTGWKIVTMAFTSVNQGCASRPSPSPPLNDSGFSL